MTVAYSPALDVSDDPARQPNERPFVPSAGGAPAFDIDSIFEASYTGDFWSVATAYTDAGKTDLADTAGDLIYTMGGGRTAGSKYDLVEATASRRPEIMADGTYTIAMKWIGGAVKRVIGSGAMSFANGCMIGMRMYIEANATQADSFIIGSDSSPEEAALGFGVISSGNEVWMGESSAAYVGTTSYSTGQWITVIGRYVENVGDNDYEIYVDSDTATATATSATNMANSRNRIYLGQVGAGAPNNVRIHRAFHINRSDVSIADVRSWLEAAS